MDVSKEIIKTAAAVKKKVRDLKRRKFTTDILIKESWGPIVEPLEKFAKTATSKRPPSPPSPPASPLLPSPPSPPHVKDEDDDLAGEEDEAAAVVPEEEPVGFTYAEDSTFGPYYDDRKKEYMLGSQPLKVDSAIIRVGDHTFKTSIGLTELIMKKEPNKVLITQRDKENYGKILQLTNLHRKPYTPEGKLRSSGGNKYMNFIRPLLQREKEGTGYKFIQCGQPDPPVRINWNDPNRLCNRLRLLVASRDAGHTGHEREINAIISELRGAGYIL
jgi:hypothetical protein